MRSFYLQNFILISLVVQSYVPGKFQSVKNEQRSITPKKGKAVFSALHINLYEIYLPTKFYVEISYILRAMPGHSSKYKHEQRAITQKLGKAELWLLCTAHLLNKIYLPIKFHVDIFYSLGVMTRTKFKR
jgi:hypothetical protein